MISSLINWITLKNCMGCWVLILVLTRMRLRNSMNVGSWVLNGKKSTGSDIGFWGLDYAERYGFWRLSMLLYPARGSNEAYYSLFNYKSGIQLETGLINSNKAHSKAFNFGDLSPKAFILNWIFICKDSLLFYWADAANYSLLSKDYCEVSPCINCEKLDHHPN